MKQHPVRQRLVLASVLAVLAPASAHAASTVARDNIDALIELQAKANKVPAAFVHRVVKRESNYNPNAKGGSALGLMQIKHATARGLGYKGDAAGLYDPETNLKYGIAYLAGAYRAAKGDLDQAYRYYNRGYYYVAKQLGISSAVPDGELVAATAPAATSATGFAGLFGMRTSQPGAGDASVAGTPALAYSAAPTVVAAVEVPLPPRRPAALGGVQEAVEIAAVQPVAAPPASTVQPNETAAAELVEVPLPPRRPSAVVLASVGRPAVARRPDAASPVQEAAALPLPQ